MSDEDRTTLVHLCELSSSRLLWKSSRTSSAAFESWVAALSSTSSMSMQEALQLMPVGSKWEVYIPSELAYGSGGQGPIPPSSALVFEVELQEIK